MAVICMDEKVWIALVERVKTLSAWSRQVEQKFNPKTSDGWIDSQDVCLALKVSKRTLQSYRERGIFPFSGVGGKFFYREADVAAYLESKAKLKQGTNSCDKPGSERTDTAAIPKGKLGSERTGTADTPSGRPGSGGTSAAANQKPQKA